jgi:hypothetical protein
MTVHIQIPAEPVEPSPTLTSGPSPMFTTGPSPTAVSPGAGPHGAPSNTPPAPGTPSHTGTATPSPTVLPTTGPGGDHGVLWLALLGALVLLVGAAVVARTRRGNAC